MYSTVINCIIYLNVVKRVNLKRSHYKKETVTDRIEVVTNCYGGNNFAIYKFIKSISGTL